MSKEQEYAQHLLEVMYTEDPRENDFVALCVAGERLQRVINLQGGDAALASEKLLAGYRELRASFRWRRVSPDKLLLRLEEALQQLGAYASLHPYNRNEETLQNFFWEVDAVLCMEEGWRMHAMADHAYNWARNHCIDYVCLWELSSELESKLGPDVHNPGRFRWTKPFADRFRLSEPFVEPTLNGAIKNLR